MTTHMSPSPNPMHGGRLAHTPGKTLPLVAAALSVEAKAGLAKVRFSQRFANAHAEPLTVTYRLPLPADAAVGGYVFEVGKRRIVGRVETKRIARETYEAALADGRSAALLEEERSSLFTQEIGNIPPGTEVGVEITLDVPLAWIERGAWELRFPLAAAPRYLGGDADALGNVVIDVASGALAARASLVLLVRDALAQGKTPESPSHPLQCKETPEGFRVTLGSDNNVELDRDVVVRWPVALPTPAVSIDVARPEGDACSSAFGLLTIVPPSPDLARRVVARDVTLLIDTSGSMHGSPLEQAKRISAAIVLSLGDGDTFELIEFGSTARPYRSGPLPATKPEQTGALKWIAALQASGGTEMLSGIRAALAPSRAASQRQVVLITDGLIGFERDIVAELLAKLPSSCRFHAVGVGAAANRSLLMPVARAGRGIEAIVGIGEDAEPAALRILARMRDPVVVDLQLGGSALVSSAPRRLPDLYGGSPARIAVELRPEGGDLVMTGRTADGFYGDSIKVAPLRRGAGNEAVGRLFARERVEDLETDIVGGGARELLERAIERIGLEHQISTRLTSFVAVTEGATVNPNDPMRRETMPQALPFGMSAEGLGLRAPMPMGGGFAPMLAPIGAMSIGRASGGAPPGMGAPPPPPQGFASGARMGPPAAAPPAMAGRPRMAAAPVPHSAKPESKAASVFDDVLSESKGEAAPRAPTPAIRGRIALKQGARIVMEFDVPTDHYEFVALLLMAIVVTRDGARSAARMDAGATTRSGTYAAGVTLRVVIDLDGVSATDVDVVELWQSGDFVVEAR